MNSPWSKHLSTAMGAVSSAAVLCRRVHAAMGAQARSKSDLSPVTVADYGSQAIICSTLAAAYPSIPIVGEEDSADLRRDDHAVVLEAVRLAVADARGEASTRQVLDWIDLGAAPAPASRFWTLDPIDGTKGYLRGEQYAVALALVEEGEVVLGLLSCPNLTLVDGPLGTLVWAARGEGAFRSSLDSRDTNGTRLLVSSCEDPADARMCESVESGHSAHDVSARIADRLGLRGRAVRLDSQAKYAVVAAGEAELYLRLPTRANYREKIWDHAAGALIVEEAGGLVTDIHGKALDFRRGRELVENQGVVATNRRLHERVLESIRE